MSDYLWALWRPAQEPKQGAGTLFVLRDWLDGENLPGTMSVDGIVSQMMLDQDERGHSATITTLAAGTPGL